ncbi:MAG TPA: alternative ribosome rescue aminoacyl-tRNA hydrolase ArfB, partial [Longimicrobiales bacterium]|nr:alternative ribosome rescue aminoacyl-tRNA hydrolase ArfB [Longimicrobiales bacterium]
LSDVEDTTSAIPEHALLRVTDALVIPLAELGYKATRSGGPGGQHVNTSSTRIELEFDVGASPSLTDAQRATIRERLANRIDGAGILRLSSSGSRSQHQNREDVTARLARLLADALHERKPRRKTKVPRAAKRARLDEKKKRSRVKKDRGPVRPED